MEVDHLRAIVVAGRLRACWVCEDVGGPVIVFEKPDLKFADVGGMEKLKEEIQMKIISDQLLGR